MKKIRFGQVKVFAHRLLRGQPIPIFRDREMNRAIDRHVDRIATARTARPKRKS